MDTTSRTNKRNLNSLFFFSYFGLGALLPLLSLYLESIGFNGVQIGSIFSIRALMAILVPPIWGLISDRFGNHKLMLLITFIMTLAVTFLLPMTKSYILFALAYALFNFFQTASTPLSDGIALHSTIPFGDIRKWGAYGFAIAALASGYVARVINLPFIFVVFGLSVMVSIFVTLRLKVNIPVTRERTKSQLPLLFKDRKFLIFLLYCFLLGSTLISHNTFFGLYFESLGGHTTWIGLAFFLFAMSEAPFMMLTGKLIPKYGIYNILIFSNIVALIRWFFYFSTPSVALILILFPLQGMFFGTFIAGTAEYVKKTVDPSIRSTAVATYSAVFLGVGGAFANFLGGYIYEYINIESVYGFFGILAALGFIVLLYLRKTAPIESAPIESPTPDIT